MTMPHGRCRLGYGVQLSGLYVGSAVHTDTPHATPYHARAPAGDTCRRHTIDICGSVENAAGGKPAGHARPVRIAAARIAQFHKFVESSTCRARNWTNGQCSGINSTTHELWAQAI